MATSATPAAAPDTLVSAEQAAPGGWQIHAWRLGILIAGFGLWEVAARMKWIDPYLISSPNAIANRLWSLARSGAMVDHVYVSAIETLLGFVIGAVLGILLGMALAPLFVVWFGIGITSKVAVGASIVVFTCLFATYIGMRNTDAALLRAIKALGATNQQLLMKVQLPFAIPWIFAGLKTSVAMALIGAIIGEFIAAGKGVGWYIAYAGGQFDTTGVFAGLVILGAMAVALDVTVARVGRRIMRWKPDVEA
jgi:NitT/TauT family transport system permease protein